MRFDRFFVLQPDDAIAYAKERGFFPVDAELESEEIGDGNINYVFRLRDRRSGRSLIIKQGGETARISDAFRITPDRVRIEYEMLKRYNELAPGLVPEVYAYDEVMHAFAMEDLSRLSIMRRALMEHRKLPHFVEHITTFLVQTLFYTTDIAMDPKEKKALVQRYINPDLCEITEDLVYTEPFTDAKRRNDPYPPNREWIERMIYGDGELRREVAKLKWQFMTEAQALIHGDLHTGSIFVDERETKVIDPEFAFFGPIGYDVGNVVANLMFAWANAEATMEDEAARLDYLHWLEQAIAGVVDRFRAKFLAAWHQDARDPLARGIGVAEDYVDRVIVDSAGVTGLELARRIIGLAHVKDITSISDPEKRLKAERTLLRAAKVFIIDRYRHLDGSAFVVTLKTAHREEEKAEKRM
ncbi:S-methyl-5-thioribose kinase [Hydrogenibacillus sp. N12]|uniref:S-methyl-5-thioribose kinase n=1 Tax=Hydrogenibacillus sp. N12 TaxID=2866627 RepID=UPI001C7E0F9B|nr:S-methyl-5-thioribose kinase [Hydrogenibacillus sp. N12]QZA32757.1 S-methyl-5-thioribose kinase [Hydrogenibacillus sp. N12]